MTGPVYVAGPMTGVPRLNYPAFFEASARIREAGFRVINPAELDLEDGDPYPDEDQTEGAHSFGYYLRRDIPHLCMCNTVAVLPGWARSRGANLEVHIGRELGMDIVDAETLKPISCADEALGLVSGARNAFYGHPLDDYTKTGWLWAPILAEMWVRPILKLDVPKLEPVPAEAATLCMGQVKVSRECNRAKRDNIVDGIGYWACYENVLAERKRRG